jgi:hypothetical protein
MRLLQTVYGDVAPVDPVGARRCEEHDYIGNLFGGAEPAHRKTVAHVVVKIVRIGKAVAVPAIPSTRIEPGETVLTRSPCGTNSSAQRSVSKISAALAAPYCPDIASCGVHLEIDAMLITAAPGRPFICAR